MPRGLGLSEIVKVGDPSSQPTMTDKDILNMIRYLIASAEAEEEINDNTEKPIHYRNAADALRYCLPTYHPYYPGKSNVGINDAFAVMEFVESLGIRRTDSEYWSAVDGALEFVIDLKSGKSTDFRSRIYTKGA